MAYYSLQLLLTVFNSACFRQASYGKRKRLFTQQVGNGSARGFGEHESVGRGTG